MPDPIGDTGALLMRRFDELGAISEEPDKLVRAYGMQSLRRAQDLVSVWMRDAGMTVERDAIGNLTGRYEADFAVTHPKTVVFGGHLDTVRDAGKYDGTLGVLSGIAAVAHLQAAGTWLPFAVEVVAFADEESYRFPTMYLGSGYWTGNFDPVLLEGLDETGISLAQGMRDFGCNPDNACLPVMPRRDILAFVELHIEQGPVLEAEDLPAGIVSSIAGASKFLVTVEGQAGHAGTVPMHLRRDALVGASECVLAINEIATAGADGGLVATVGWQVTMPGAKNVIPGRVEFSIDLRHPSDTARLAAVDHLKTTLHEIGQRRGLGIDIVDVPGADATPMDAGLMDTWRDVFRESGLQPRELASGAGHDAVMVAKIAPVSMLFLRCRGGLSHHPGESIRADDAALGVTLLSRFLDRLATRGITCA